jgi:hypothetical protein
MKGEEIEELETIFKSYNLKLALDFLNSKKEK